MSEQDWLTTSAGITMPRIIYGTAWKKEQTAELVEQAIIAGFRGIDTACQPKHYDEKLVGVGIQRMREKGIEREALYIQTKFTPLSSQDPHKSPYSNSSCLEEQVLQSFDVSLDNLQTDYLDCLLLHSPLQTHEQTMQAWHTMETLSGNGGIRQLGISNCYDIEVFKQLYTDAAIKPAIVQNRFYKDTHYELAMRNWCAPRGIIFQSFWSLTANSDILGSPLVHKLAQDYSKTTAQIFFRYLSQSGIVPLTGTTSIKHMREDLDIFEFKLSAKDLDEMKLLFSA